MKQECIPVGCVPSAAVAVSREGGSASAHAGIHTPPGVGLETPPCQTPQAPPWVWAWKPARHAGIPPARHAGIPPPRPVDRQTRVKT